MLLDLDALQALDAIDRKGSFARAGEELGRVPSAITYLIRKLEGDLDVLLFDRRGHKAKLTPAGQELLREGRHLLIAASDLQRRVRRVGDGWEVELRIAMDTIIRMDAVLALVAEFYREEPGTRIRLLCEVLSGTWEALLSGRADLAIGTFAITPNSAGVVSGYQSRLLGETEMVFVVAPSHPLADATEPITPEVVRRHRAVAVGDTARNLAPVTIGLLGGQDVLTVPTMRDKVAAQVAGLGCGNVPVGYALPYIESGRLVPRLLAESRVTGSMYYAWNTAVRGKAMQWFRSRLEDPKLRRALLP
ncbi:MAG: LysR family transcriptional regulator [Burkholderiaceae bacterium]